MVAVQARGGRRGEPARGGEINLSPVPARQEAVAAFNPHSTYPCHTPHLRPPQLRSSPATPRCATCACGAARTHAAPGAAGAARRWRGGRSTSVWRFPAWPCWPASAACSRQVTWTALCCAAPLLHRGSVTGSVPHMRAHAHMHAPPPPPPPPRQVMVVMAGWLPQPDVAVSAMGIVINTSGGAPCMCKARRRRRRLHQQQPAAAFASIAGGSG